MNRGKRDSRGVENPGRRSFLKWCAGTAGTVGAVHLFSAAALDSWLEYKEIQCVSEKIPPQLDGYRAVFLTDIHGYAQDKLAEMVEVINRTHVDLVLLGGDFSGQKSLDRCMEILADIDAKDGIYGVEGNHDRADRLRDAMEGQGMTLLENSGVLLHKGLFLAGVEDLYNRSPSIDQAVGEAGEEDFVLLVCHNPDVSVIQDASRVDLMLCGHTHGGEISFLGIWAPAMPFVSRYGQRFVGGWCRSAAGTPVYVSKGVGQHAPLRVFARPQVIGITLKSG